MPKMPSNSEYASISPSKQRLDDVIINGRLLDKEGDIIDKITAKYDSLEKLRGSIDELDLNDDVTSPHSDGEEEEGDANRSINVYRFNQDDNRGVPSEQELQQVESFFSGHKTSVYVCPSMISVYFSTLESTTLPVHNGPLGDRKPVRRLQSTWQLAHDGIPLLLLDMGETRSRSKRRIQIVIAERGTGFLLWRDTIDNLTNYQAIDSHFHTMFMSCDHRKLVGLSFHSVAGAREFYERVERLTSDPANISLSSPNSKAARAKSKKKQTTQKQQQKQKQQRKTALPKKSDISQPCCFQHVTRLETADKDYYVTLATLTGTNDNSKSRMRDKNELHKYKSEPSLRINAIS